jgi:hypothetical protein
MSVPARSHACPCLRPARSTAWVSPSPRSVPRRAVDQPIFIQFSYSSRSEVRLVQGSECGLASGRSELCSRWCVLRVVLCECLVHTVARAKAVIWFWAKNVGTFLCSTFFDSFSCRLWCINIIADFMKKLFGKFHAFNRPRELVTIIVTASCCTRCYSHIIVQ